MTIKKSSKAVLAVIVAISVLAPALVLVLPLPVFAAIENVFEAAPGDTATVPIIVYDVTDLAAGTLRVTYDSSVCNVTDITTGELTTIVKNLGTPGLAVISAFDSGTGHTGDVTLANLKIKAIGSCGDSSPLNITVETLGTYNGTQNIQATVSNGTFTILSGPTPSHSPSATEPPAGGFLGDGGGSEGTIAPTPTSPGFGAIFFIAGLLAVAYLMMRKRKAVLLSLTHNPLLSLLIR